MKIEFDLDLPPEITHDPALAQELVAEARQHTILRLLVDEKIALATAASLLHVDRVQLWALLQRHGLPQVMADAEGIEADLAALEEYWRTHPHEGRDERRRLE